MDIYFALHILRLQRQSGSWRAIKDKVRSGVLDGWRFIEQVSTASLECAWTECEQDMFNLRRFCDASIESVPVLRLIAENDWVVPRASIDAQYWRHFKQVLVSRRGGHCAVSRCKRTMDAVAAWNDDIVNDKE